MEAKKQNLMNNTDLESLMNIVNLNSNLMEATKSIKAKNNESAIKALKALKDKPAVWPELIITAFSAQNFKVVEYMYENYGIDLGGFLEITANMISSELLQEQGPSPKNLFSEKDKEMFLTVKVPFNIIAATSGDIDIFHLVKEKGANLNATGHICLSKKQKNSVISNILGAAAYYGRSDLTDYILKKHSVDLNFKCTEKKVKKKQVSNLIKEFTDMTPLLLAVASDAPESNSIEVIKHLLDKNVNLSAVDFNKNTFLHLAVKHNKLEIIKYFQDLLNPFLFEANKEGQTPFALAQELNFSEILHFLNSISVNVENNKNLEEELNELIESTNQQKNKKKKKANKKNAKDEVRLLNSAGFQETLKIKQPSAAASKQPQIASNAVKHEKEKIEEIEETVETDFDNTHKNNNFNNNEEAKFRGKSRGGYEYDNAEDYYNADRNANRNINNANTGNAKRGYRYNNDQYSQQYDENYNYAEYDYTDRYGNANYKSGYNGGFKGRYGYQNHDRSNNGRYYRNERDNRYNNRDYGKAGKSFEKAEIIEKPVKYEEKISNADSAVNNKESEKFEKDEIKSLPIDSNTNSLNNIANTTSNAVNENTNNLIISTDEGYNQNKSENKDSTENKNILITNAVNNNNTNNPNNSNNSNNNNNNNNTDKEIKVAKEKKIIGLDAKTLKKLEKKEKRTKAITNNNNTINEKRKLSKDESAETEKESTNINQLEKQEEKAEIELNDKNAQNLQKNEQTTQVISQAGDLVDNKPSLDLESEIKEENKQNKIDDNELLVTVSNQPSHQTIEKENEEKNYQVENQNAEIFSNAENISEEETKEKAKENRMQNIYLNENLIYSKELIKKYYVDQCLILEENLEKEKREKELYYKALVNKNLELAKENLKSKNSSEKYSDEKLEDLLHLANQELETKSKKINQVFYSFFNFRLVKFSFGIFGIA